MRARKRLRRDRVVTKADVGDRDGIPTVALGPANIWDGGDLGRLRDAAAEVFAAGNRRIGVDLTHVGVLPTGFLHMLCTWQERGAEVYLFTPRSNVRDMFWFRTFAEPISADVWRMSCVTEEAEPRNPFQNPAARLTTEDHRFDDPVEVNGTSGRRPAGDLR